MVPRKVIQDSDEESDASVSPIKAIEGESQSTSRLSDAAAPQQSGDPSTGSTELLAREIHVAQKSLTEPSPKNGRALYEPRSTEAEQHSMSPDLPRNKRRKTTTAIIEDARKASDAKRRKSTNVYGLEGSSQPDCETYGSNAEKRQASKEGDHGGRDLWEFPGSSASDDPLAPRHETGSTRVKSRNAGGHTSNVDFSRELDRRQSSPIKASFETHDILSHDGKSTQSAKSHGTDPLAGTSFKIDLTDPTLVLTASQKEQYQQLSATTSTPGSLPSPLPDDTFFINPYGKFSDASSTIPNSTPSKQAQAGRVEINPFPGTRTSPDMSVISVAMQTPSQASQTGSKSSHTPRRSKSSLGLQSPDHDKSNSSTRKKKADTSIPNPKTKRRSKTTPSVSSQYSAEEVALGDLSLPATVLDIPNTTAPKTTKKRKAKGVDELGSEDIAIGLPKEQYKPRPSRSRGNINLDGLLESMDFSKRPEAQVKAKNKRRKTHESEAPSITEEAVSIPVSRDTREATRENKTEQAIGTTKPAAVPSEAATVHEGDIAEKVEDDTQSLPNPVKLKRKLPVDDTTEHGANASNAHLQNEPKAPTNPTTKPPAPKPRGRPRKKTDEKPLPIPIPTTAEVPPETPDPKPPTIQSPHLSQPDYKNNPNPNPNPTAPLEETSTNPKTTPSDVQLPRPSTPPPHHTTILSLPATPSQTQQTTDSQKGPGPQKHSPLNSGRVPYRVGLSKRARIEPLLRGFRK